MSLRVLVGVSRSAATLHALGISPASSRHWSVTCDAAAADLLSSGYLGSQAAPSPQPASSPDPSVASPAPVAGQDASLPATSATPLPAPWWGLLSRGAHIPGPCVGVRAFASLSSPGGLALSRPSNITSSNYTNATRGSNANANSLLPHLRLLHQGAAPHGPGAGPREHSTGGAGRAPRTRDTAAGYSPHLDSSSVDKAKDRSGSGIVPRGGRGEGDKLSAPRRGGPAAASPASAPPPPPAAKELQLGPRIGEHDLRTKLRRAEGWLALGLRVQVAVEFKKEDQREAAAALADQVAERLAALARPVGPRRQQRGAWLTLLQPTAAAAHKGAADKAAREAAGRGAKGRGEGEAAVGKVEQGGEGPGGGGGSGVPPAA